MAAATTNRIRIIIRDESQKAIPPTEGIILSPPRSSNQAGQRWCAEIARGQISAGRSASITISAADAGEIIRASTTGPIGIRRPGIIRKEIPATIQIGGQTINAIINPRRAEGRLHGIKTEISGKEQEAAQPRTSAGRSIEKAHHLAAKTR
ncbi:MAG: hypothetical protein M3R63_21065 [Actinomycetota bacterium]|nr:hypothetical protein [Actinomycetota bacterium]